MLYFFSNLGATLFWPRDSLRDQRAKRPGERTGGLNGIAVYVLFPPLLQEKAKHGLFRRLLTVVSEHCVVG